MSRFLVVIGAGDLGLRVAALHATQGDQVSALRRRKLPMPDGVQAVYGDMQEAETLMRLPTTPDVLLFCPTPDARTEAGYRKTYVQALEKAMHTLKPKRVLFVSSTAVYAQDSGEWVDETSIAEAPRFNGNVLREAEQLCLSLSGNVVLRLSGITSPDRHMLINKALLGEGLNNTWTNRIHIDDAASAISFLIAQHLPDSIYNISDDEPALQIEVANWIRQKHALPPLPIPQSQASGNRISNARIEALGWQPQYPSFRECYAF
jgi:nucleoside-diphosphate-sugar epimerase